MKKTLTLTDHKQMAVILKGLHETLIKVRTLTARKAGKVASAGICRALDEADSSLFMARDALDHLLFKTLGKTNPEELRRIYFGGMETEDLRLLIHFIYGDRQRKQP